MESRIPASVLLLSGVLLGSPASLRADSDGYYCSGPGYLAYELSFSFGATAHVLYLVALSDSIGIGHPAAVALPRFQVHAMRCDSGAVELLGWDSLYTVRFRQARAPSVASVTSRARPVVFQRPLPGYPTGNLGGWSSAVRAGRPDTVDLHVVGARHRFVLALDLEADANDPCSYMVRTRIVQFEQARVAIDVLTLFQGRVPRECGE